MSDSGMGRPMMADPEELEQVNAEVLSAGFGQGGLPSVGQSGNNLMINTQHGFVTAQRVPVPRNLKQFMAKLKVLCHANGEQYVYSWDVKDRYYNRTVTVEGVTVKAMNDLAREYGNCVITIADMRDMGEKWMLVPRFTDLETGFSYERPFVQRKGQNTGMRDGGRAEDLIFQIGASKAIRNVVRNALQTFADYMLQESKLSVTEKFSDPDNRKRALDYIEKKAAQFDIEMKRIEAVVGRKVEAWTNRDLARVYFEIRGIADGDLVASEVYPSSQDAERIMRDKQADKADRGRAPADEPNGEQGKTADAAASGDSVETGGNVTNKAEPDKNTAPASGTVPAGGPFNGD